jgi:hypothetical protein
MQAQGLQSPKPSFVGSIELRGSDDSLTVIVHANEHVIAPSAGRWIFGNRIVLQLRRSKVEGQDAVTWSAKVFEALCAALSPLHGDVHSYDEYHAKNMSHEGGGLQAVGVDASKYLPGLYWLNFFGRSYCDFIGQKRLLSAPAPEVHALDAGVFLRLADDPRSWPTPAYQSAESSVLDHLGRQYFFSKQEPHRRTIAPSFDLPQSSVECFSAGPSHRGAGRK